MLSKHVMRKGKWATCPYSTQSYSGIEKNGQHPYLKFKSCTLKHLNTK